MSLDPNKNPVFNNDMEVRYEDTNTGEVGQVKDVLGAAHTTPVAGRIIDATSANGAAFQDPNGFKTKVQTMQSQYLEVTSNGTQGISAYAQGLSNRKYKP